ncbi:hypothetical protein PV05_04112 [Exophiala xenobiotica]|uniref:Bud22 domain-containing protein n=1 Tax=Exophiala xenobiotica TaxID=348802 RepID=A0A0D2DBK2_9EURO|nr:uncharacterized protein PV05_04112 [Exophiala xenobiotica]KIW59677.1 hypothetical protein PV05_04112 [Exophiala xenobiotica]
MAKRKREDDMDDGDSKKLDPVLENQVSRLRAKLTYGIKSLHAALKLARGFEKQKLGRRQKAASSEPHNLLRLREEVIVLKQLKLDRTARQYVIKQLVKTKRIKEHPAFIQVYGPDPVLDPTKSIAEGNVIGRLFNSGPVKQVLPGIMNGIYDALDISQAGPDKIDIKRDKRAVTSKSKNSEDEDVFDGFSDREPDDGEAVNDDLSGSEMDNLLDQYAGRLASSDDETNDDASADLQFSPSDSISEQGNLIRPPREDLSISASPEPVDRRERPSNTEKIVKPLSSTAFLPSLSLGGYYSGSDSETGDLNYNRGPPLRKERKNRRGQRARQKLAEMKFGKKANHIAQQTATRQTSWDPKRGAVGENDRRQHRFRDGKVSHKANGAATQGNTVPLGKPKKRDDSGSLHPSWEAIKKRKESQTQAIFTGKKVTFD